MALLLLSGLSFTSVMPTVAMAQGTPIARPSPRDLYADHIAEASQRFGIPERWIRTVLRAESAGDARAASTAGAMGLMQVMPDTWAVLRDRYQLGRDPWEPRDNILAGAAYLREMWDRYGKHRASGRPLPAETRAYIVTLAPVLGGAAASDAPPGKPTLPRDWRAAPLFVLHSNSSRATVGPSFEAQSGGLFAAVSGPDRR